MQVSKVIISELDCNDLTHWFFEQDVWLSADTPGAAQLSKNFLENCLSKNKTFRSAQYIGQYSPKVEQAHSTKPHLIKKTDLCLVATDLDVSDHTVWPAEVRKIYLFDHVWNVKLRLQQIVAAFRQGNESKIDLEIMCSYDISFELLKFGSLLGDVRLFILDKHPRIRGVLANKSKYPKSIKRILFLVEPPPTRRLRVGDEVGRFFVIKTQNAMKRSASSKKAVIVRWRLHPTERQIHKLYKYRRRTSIESDIKWATLVVGSGSGALLQAHSAGKPLVLLSDRLSFTSKFKKYFGLNCKTLYLCNAYRGMKPWIL